MSVEAVVSTDDHEKRLSIPWPFTVLVAGGGEAY